MLVALVGTGAAFAFDAVSFAIAALALLAMRGGRTLRHATGDGAASARTRHRAPAKAGLLTDIRAGAAYAAADPAIRTLLLLSAVFNLAINGPIAVGLPWLADQRFAADASVFGLMIAGFGLGALVGALIAGSRQPGATPGDAAARHRRRHRRGHGPHRHRPAPARWSWPSSP